MGHRLKPQVSRQMPRVCQQWVGRCCLSIFTIGHAYPLPRLNACHLRDSHRKLPMKRNSFLRNKYKKTEQTWTLLKLKNTKNWTWQSTKQTWTLLKFKIQKTEHDGAQNKQNTKTLNYKVSKNEHTTNEDKNKQIHYQIKRLYNTI